LINNNGECKYVSNWKSARYDDENSNTRTVVNVADCCWSNYIGNWKSNKYDDQNTNARQVVNRCVCVRQPYLQHKYRHRK
jgi:hypothetical protein